MPKTVEDLMAKVNFDTINGYISKRKKIAHLS